MQESPCAERGLEITLSSGFKEEEPFPGWNNGCQGSGPQRRKGWDQSLWLGIEEFYVQAEGGFRARPRVGEIPSRSSLSPHQ